MENVVVRLSLMLATVDNGREATKRPEGEADHASMPG